MGEVRPRVWLRHGEDLQSFPLQKVGNKKKHRLLLKPVAEFWNLDASGMSNGKNQLSGRNIDAEEIRALADHSGDGSSMDSAIQITSRSKRRRDEKDEKEVLDILNAKITEVFEAPALKEPKEKNTYERMKRYHRGPNEADLARVKRHAKWHDARRAVFFGPGCMYQYSQRLLEEWCKLNHNAHEKVAAFEELLFGSVAPFVGTLHAVPPSSAVASSEQQRQQIEGGNFVVGLVTLWKLDGACLTAHNCIKDALSSDKLLFVHMEPVPGETVMYQCKAEVLEAWALLQPIHPNNIGFEFKACTCLGRLSNYWETLYTFSLEENSGANLKNVKVAPICSAMFSYSITLLPDSKMCALGAPVFDNQGLLSGIVTGFRELEEGPSLSTVMTTSEVLVEEWSSLRGRVKTISELEAEVRKYKNFDDNLYKVGLEGLKTKQLVEATWTRSPDLVEPLDQWCIDHPIEEVCPEQE